MLSPTLIPGQGGAPASPMGTQSPLAASSAAPIGAVPTSTNPLATTQNNPFAAPTATSINGAVPISTNNPSTVQTNGVNFVDGSNTVIGDFKDTYGAGTGTAITDVLKNMGTVNDSAIQATINNTNLAAGKQLGNIQAQEAASGVTPDSSVAALAAGDLYSTVDSGLMQEIGSMENNQEQTLLSTLTGEGGSHGTDPSTWDSVMNGISDAGKIAGSAVQVAGLFGL